jgi:hypothetical protein
MAHFAKQNPEAEQECGLLRFEARLPGCFEFCGTKPLLENRSGAGSGLRFEPNLGRGLFCETKPNWIVRLCLIFIIRTLTAREGALELDISRQSNDASKVFDLKWLKAQRIAIGVDL